MMVRQRNVNHLSFWMKPATRSLFTRAGLKFCHVKGKILYCICSTSKAGSIKKTVAIGDKYSLIASTNYRGQRVPTEGTQKQ